MVEPELAQVGGWGWGLGGGGHELSPGSGSFQGQKTKIQGGPDGGTPPDQ
jgi:hypothetical protein